MKKVLFVWLLFTGCSVNPDPSSNTLTILQDSLGNKHSYRYLKLNRDNWCTYHQKYEFVERRFIHKKRNQRILSRKNQKNSKLT
jgi:hypothetical protein